ncbi:MAG: hypothetical protein FJ279_28535, partial [Planctomycetes bacterium]|nr:hypothetical protein [Planctomycetota bacterium]
MSLAVLSCSSALAGTPTDGLIFYQDFDHDGRALCGTGWAYDQSIPREQLVPGRFGNACRFERPRKNLLSPNQASMEEDSAGFLGGKGATLASLAAETPFGRKALRAEAPVGGVAWQTAPVQAKVQAPHRPMKVFVFSASLRTDGPQVKVRLTLSDQNEGGDWRARIEAATAKDAKAAKPAQETVSAPGEATLGATWQRVAARLEMDARREEQSLVGALTVLEGAPATVWADGLQLEQTCIYPLTNTDPTSW